MEEKTNEEQEISAQKEESREAVKSVTLSPLNPVPGKQERANRNIDMLLDIHIPVLVELGKTEMMISEILGLIPGSIIELDSLAGEPVKITVRGKTIALGEVVVVDENFGVKISKISEQEERIECGG